MAAIKPSIKEVLYLEKSPIVLEWSHEMEAFAEEKLDSGMQPNNVKDKYAVAIFQERKKKVIGHLPLRKSGKFAKTIFTFYTQLKKIDAK